jgi:glycosyltransferase involved in cell wall biosynthesis
MQGQPWGGSEELWSQTAVRLKLEGHDVQASVEYRPHLSEKFTELARTGIGLETHFSGQGRRARRIWNKLSYNRQRGFSRLKKFNPDLVVISQGSNSGGFEWASICRRAAIPYVVIVQCNSETWWFADQEVGEAVAIYTAARKVFCVSQHNLDLLRLQLGVPLENGEVVWNPYNVSPESVLDWPDESRVWRLACVARLDLATKGQDLLVQILARPEWRERPVELNLFGVGPYEQSLRRLCGMLELNNVHFRGYVSDVRAIWEHNHLLVQPSRYEGVPMTVMEAMWCGRAAVVTNVGRMPELCVDGETGFVAQSATLPSLSEALQRAWDARAKWSLLGEAARARAEERIPKDPTALFCERLNNCAATKFSKATAPRI